MSTLLQPFELPPESQPKPLSKLWLAAQGDMAFYIYGCQPRLVAEVLRGEHHIERRPCEPGNLAWFAWQRCLRKVAQHLRLIGEIKLSSVHDCLVAMLEPATKQAMAEVDHLFDLPLTAPLQFRCFDDEDWAPVAHLYRPRVSV